MKDGITPGDPTSGDFLARFALFKSREPRSRLPGFSFWQEIYDGEGKLAGIHEKYPVDKGQQKA